MPRTLCTQGGDCDSGYSRPGYAMQGRRSVAAVRNHASRSHHAEINDTIVAGDVWRRVVPSNGRRKHSLRFALQPQRPHHPGAFTFLGYPKAYQNPFSCKLFPRLISACLQAVCRPTKLQADRSNAQPLLLQTSWLPLPALGRAECLSSSVCFLILSLPLRRACTCKTAAASPRRSTSW